MNNSNSLQVDVQRGRINCKVGNAVKERQESRF